MVVTMRKVRLDRGGYTPEGRYFGVGAPIYHATWDEPLSSSYGPYETWFRAKDRKDAEAQLFKYMERHGFAQVRGQRYEPR